MNSTAALARQAGMTDAQWKEAVKFDSTDWGWIIMSIGMAIGAGIVFARSGRPGRRMGLFILSYHRLSGYLSLTALIHQYPGRFAAVRRLSQRHQRLPR